MSELLTLIADVDEVRRHAEPPPDGFSIQPCLHTMISELGRLYYEAYDPGEASSTVDEATADIRASFGGEYGLLAPHASKTLVHGEELVAAILTVQHAPWENTPQCPFVIELFTARNFRRRGLARVLVTSSAIALARLEEESIALRVAANNTAARTLYESLGFRAWTDHERNHPVSTR